MIDKTDKSDIDLRQKRRYKVKILLLFLYGLLFLIRLYGQISACRMLEADIGQTCKIEGQVIWRKTEPFGENYYIKASQIRCADREITTTLKFQFYSQEKIQLHSKIKVTGELAFFSMPKNPGERNKNHYYKGKNIYYRIKPKQIEIVESGSRSYIDYFRDWVDAQTAKYLPERERGLFISLFSGDRSELEKEMIEDFRKVGVSHILAVSGLHVGLLAWFFSSILKRLPLPYPLQYLILMLILSFYTIFTGAQASTLRAVIMFGLLESSYFWNTEPNPKLAYGLTLAILLLINPFSFYDIGFVLSFATVAAILYIYPLVIQDGPKILRMVGLTLTVQIVLLPVFSLYFHRISVVALLANLWIVPAMSYFLAMSGIALAISCISVSLAQIIAGSGYYLAGSAIWIADKLSDLSWSELPIRAMNYGEIFCFYIILLAVLITKRKRLLWGLLFVVLVFIPFSWQPRLTMLDVGQAESMVLEYRDKTLVIDAGLESNKSTAAYLAYRGKSKIDMILLSHLDKDHAGGLEHLLENFSVGSIGISVSYRSLTKEMAELFALTGVWNSYRQLVQLAEHYNVPISYWQAGDRIGIADLHFSFLYPAKEEIPFTANDFSFVAEMEYGQTQMLFTGDIGKEVEELLLVRDLVKDIEVLKVAHHGSKYSSHTAFLETVKPELAIISCGRYNKYGHPSAALIEELEQSRVVTKVTAWNGRIVLEFTEKGEVIINE